MVKHTIELSDKASYVSSANNQLEFHQDGDRLGQIPAEDIGLIVSDNHEATFTQQALLKLTQNGGGLVICDHHHMPSAMLLPFSSHVEVVWRLEDQLSATRPLAKRLWQQTVRAKIKAQSANLPTGSSAQAKLSAMIPNVLSGDPSNREAQAARVYWLNWLDNSQFTRNTNGNGINGLLNYGYAIMRAAVAREVVATGLSPAIGIYHSNRSNFFCLADDLMEPLRPFVDYAVRELVIDGYESMCRHVKQTLLELLVLKVQYKDQTGPLSVQIKKTVQGYSKCLAGKAKAIEFPVLCS